MESLNTISEPMLVEPGGVEIELRKDFQPAGLNDGYELDDVEVTHKLVMDDNEKDSPLEEIEIKETFNVNTEVNTVMALEGRVKDLFYLLDDLRATSGINQDMAMEAERLSPGFLSVPVQYYTITPSVTRYKEALESIAGTIWGLIISAIESIGNIILKVYNWFKGDTGTRIENQQEFLSTARRCIDKVNEKKDKVQQIISATKYEFHKKDGNVFRCICMQDIVDNMFDNKSRYQKTLALLDGKNPLYYDILTNGSYTSNLMLTVNDSFGMLGIIEQKIELLNSVIKKDINSSAIAEYTVSKQLVDKAAKEFTVKINGDKFPLKEALCKLDVIRKETEQSSSSKKLFFDEIYSKLSELLNGSKISDEIKGLDKLLNECFYIRENKLSKLESFIKNINIDSSNNSLIELLGKPLREAIFQITDELNSLILLITTAQRFYSDLNYLINECVGIATEVFIKVAEAIGHGDQKVPDELKEIVEDFKYRRQHMNELYRLIYS